MYLDLLALGEAKAAEAEFACGCAACTGKSILGRDRTVDLNVTVKGADQHAGSEHDRG